MVAASILPHMDQNHPCPTPPLSFHDIQVLPKEEHRVTDTMTFPPESDGDFPTALPATQAEDQEANPHVPGLAIHPEFPTIMLSRTTSAILLFSITLAL